MTKEVVLFSDIELGAGKKTDDFVADNLLCEVITEVKKSKNPIDLINNGDTFDFLKCPIIRDRWSFYLQHVTPQIALEKLDLIYSSHKLVFDAWKSFLEDKKNNIYFIFGNHDYELLFPSIQDKIKEILNSDNVYFRLSYSNEYVFAEHGQQHDVYFEFDKNKVFRGYKDTIELNIPAIFSGFSVYFMDSKEWHPFLERIENKKSLYKLDLSVKREMAGLVVKYFLYNMLFAIHKYIFRGYFKLYLKTIWVSLKNLFKLHFDVISVEELKNITRKINKKIIFFGHIHEKVIATENKKEVFILDTWRDSYNVSDDAWFLIPKNKRYAKVILNEKDAEIRLYDLIPKTGKLIFKKVLEDELKYIEKVKETYKTIGIKDYDIKEQIIKINLI